MPIINIFHPERNKHKRLLETIAAIVSYSLEIPQTNVWIFWNKPKKNEFFKQDWNNNNKPAPALFIQCRESYNKQQIQNVVEKLTYELKGVFKCSENEIFISFVRVRRGDLFSQGNLWN
ncbi:hypothetical protein [Taibaiella soli]|uniref:hypothetical protein n=1 Tax=Taibaiella soli TaxID=1649169 RepID=UPI001A9E1736|nr:hypothetical protein [Taibaiella soli]